MKKLNLLGDPLLHFLLLGALVFAAYQLLNPSSGVDSEQVIVVDEPRLAEFVQYRSKQFDEQQALQRIRSMSDTARAELIDEYVVEEALYRSAKRFGLEADDYVIRRRLVQKMDFMAEGVAAANTVVDTATLQQFYAENLERYFKPAIMTFTHVYFSAQQRGAEAAEALAVDALALLRSRSVAFTQAPQFGERFVYQLNYVERPLEEVADHFGDAMAAVLFALPVAANHWVGPFGSTHGSHLVLVTDQHAGYQPEFAQVADAVRIDYLATQQQDRRRVFAQEIVNSYKLRINPSLTGKTAP